MDKALKEVQDYTTIFLERVMELESGKTYLKRVVRGELKRTQEIIISKLVADDILIHQDHWCDIKTPNEINLNT